MAGIRLPDGFLDELKARLRPSAVIGRKVALKKQGKEWVGLSPFTNEKTPSFYVNDEKKIFKCFSSGFGGDVIKFLQETERLSFMEAVERLAEEAGMALPKASPEAQEAYDRRARLQAACEAAAAFFEERLRSAEGAAARAYLDRRGLPSESWARHRLGFSPADWRRTLDHLKSKGFAIDEIVEAGLAVQKADGGSPYDRFRGRLMFPIADPHGRVIAFGGRALAPDDKPKYLNSSDTTLFHKSTILYRYKSAREALGHGEGGGLIVCEGYMDAIALAEAGFPTAVAPLGTALTDDQLQLLWRAGPEPILCFDGDRAGLGAAHRAIDRALPYLEPGRSLFFSVLPDGLDPDDLIRQRGPAAMAAALDAPTPLSELLWRRERDAEPVDTPERKAGLEARLIAAAGAIKHPGVRKAYERELQQRMRDHFWRLSRRDSGDRNRQDPNVAPARPAKIRGLGLLIRAAESPALVDNAREELAAALFPDDDVAAIRDAIIDLFDSNTELDRVVLKDHLRSLGRTRAVTLLDSYPTAAPLAAGESQGREWLIALEQLSMLEGPDDVLAEAGEGDATVSLSEWRRRHQQVAERRALRARVSEAAEKADQG